MASSVRDGLELALVEAVEERSRVGQSFEEGRCLWVRVCQRIEQVQAPLGAVVGCSRAAAKPPLSYSTVTLLARFLGWSTSQPRRTAMW